MDKDEVITLSSDDECDFNPGFEKKSSDLVKTVRGNSPEVLKTCLERFKKVSVRNKLGLVIHSDKQVVEIVKLPKVPEKTPKISSKVTPEVVDLEDYSDKPEKKCQVQAVGTKTQSTIKNEKSCSNVDIIEVDESPNENDSQLENNETNTGTSIVNLAIDSPTDNQKPNEVTNDAINSDSKNAADEHQTEVLENTLNETSDQNLKFFTEFVEFCGCLEEIPKDKAKLTKKLMKRYGEADSQYIKSQEFRDVIKKCRLKVNRNNLYLIAKEVTDELIFRKKIEVHTGNNSVPEEKECQRTAQGIKSNDENTDKKSRRQNKVINKIIKKLDKLGCRIRELEEKEVDLSDEEESSYVQLQRYRERFWQIYTKLCQYTNEVADADRIYNRKICFTESKYPAINKSIENWLNKTKRFPDFSDIMKLLESQSSSLGLPSSKESIRVIASEIFQKVGAMLQRRRKYDLWDSFCGFLDDKEDPAEKDLLLDEVLKRNFEIGIKKEQEIFQHYVELQERERLEPEEVPDEEANHSPVESGNEDEKEIEDIENAMNERLDVEIKKDTEEKGVNKEVNPEICLKESKNNFKHCKSLKWRLENGGKNKNEGTNSEDSNQGLENGSREEAETEKGEEEKKSEVENKKSSEAVTTVEKMKTENSLDSPSRRKRAAEEDVFPSKKKCCTSNKENEDEDLDIFEICDGVEIPRRKTNEVFEVHSCQVFTDNAFVKYFREDEEETKKDWGGKRKVFRDLTNVKRLMEFHGRKKKISGLFSSSFFHRSFEKPSWKKRFKVSFQLVGTKGEKYALSQEDVSGKRINSNSKEEKNIRNSSEAGSGGENDEGENFFGNGNGSEEDNNGDENKKNGKNNNINDSQHEEEEEDEEENEREDENTKEQTEHSFPTEKTAELPGTNETPKSANNQTDEETKQYDISTELTGISLKKLENNKEEEHSKETTVEKPEKSNETREETNGRKTHVKEISEEYDKATIRCETKKKEEEIKETDNDPPVETLIIEETKPEKTQNLSPKTRKKDKPTDRRELCDSKRKTVRRERRKRPTVEGLPTPLPVDTFTPPPNFPSQLFLKKPTPTPSTSDEERVKRFLLHSPSSISITPPRKLTLSKPPSEAVLQALATLRNLKGISATIVKGGKPKDGEDDVIVIESSHRRRTEQKNPSPAKRRRSDVPVISNVETMDATTPKIVTVQGNVSGFESPWSDSSNNGDAQCSSSSIRISNVWGSLPNDFLQSMQNETAGCSFRQNNKPGGRKKKTPKKTVEYVVLE